VFIYTLTPPAPTCNVPHRSRRASAGRPAGAAIPGGAPPLAIPRGAARLGRYRGGHGPLWGRSSRGCGLSALFRGCPVIARARPRPTGAELLALFRAYLALFRVLLERRALFRSHLALFRAHPALFRAHLALFRAPLEIFRAHLTLFRARFRRASLCR